MSFANFTGVIGSVRTRQVQGKHGQTTVTNISIAHNDGETTTWFNKAIWGKRGEQALRSLKKGDRVTVSGTFQEQEWSRGGKSGVNRVLSAESIVIKASSSNAPLFARIGELEAKLERALEILVKVERVLDAPDTDTDADDHEDHDDFEDFDHDEEDVAF